MAGFAVVLGGIALVGFAFAPRTGRPAGLELQIVSWLFAGLLVVHGWLSLLALAHRPWSAGSLAPLLISALVVAALRRRPAIGRPAPFGWGDAVALAALAAFAICASRLWIVTSDFFYHWGVKGEKFFLAGGLDLHYLTGPSSITGWYPTLLPELYALTALAHGRFAAAEMMAWSDLWLALLWLAVRATLQQLPLEGHLRQAGIGAALAICVAGGISIRLAGGADWIIALALVAGASTFLGRPEGDPDRWTLPLAAAVAAAAKTEGVVLAAVLLGLDLARRLLRGPRRPAARPWLIALGPTLLVGSLWAAENTGAGLWPRSLSAVPSGPHVRAWLGTLRDQFVAGGATFHLPALLLLIPLLFLRPASRWLGWALALQLAFYEAVYLVSPGDPAVYVRTTFGRLAFQLLPAVVVGLVALLSETSAEGASAEESASEPPARPGGAAA